MDKWYRCVIQFTVKQNRSFIEYIYKPTLYHFEFLQLHVISTSLQHYYQHYQHLLDRKEINLIKIVLQIHGYSTSCYHQTTFSSVKLMLPYSVHGVVVTHYKGQSLPIVLYNHLRPGSKSNQAIKAYFGQSKSLIPVTNGSTEALVVTTPCIILKI